MELREFADGMKQQEQLEFLTTRMDQLSAAIIKGYSELKLVAEPVARDEEVARIDKLDDLFIEAELMVEQFHFNAKTFGYPISDAVLELYEMIVEEPYAEY